MSDSAVPPPPASPSPEVLRKALKAFKKRLKLARLDDESKLGHGPMSKGKSAIVAVTPPFEYPRAVWEALVEQGKLKRAGQGLYELVGE